MKMRFLMALMCATVFISTSCDKDDDPVIPKTPPVGAKWIDPDFAEFLMEEGLITDAETVTPDDVTEITKINCEGKNLTSLRGIEYFTELTVLYCAQNNLTKLNVRKNTKLTELSCEYNNLSTLDVSKNTQLKGLHCGYNNLTTLDISRTTQLIYLTCGDNPGVYGVFEVKAWFDNSKIPSNFTSDPWTNGRQTVQINYVRF